MATPPYCVETDIHKWNAHRVYSDPNVKPVVAQRQNNCDDANRELYSKCLAAGMAVDDATFTKANHPETWERFRFISSVRAAFFTEIQTRSLGATSASAQGSSHTDRLDKIYEKELASLLLEGIPEFNTDTAPTPWSNEVAVEEEPLFELKDPW